jgi:hypothetical protein
MIASIYTDKHPLTTKFYYNIVEVLNYSNEDEGTCQMIQEICDSNVETCVKFYDQNSIYLAKFLFTQFTSRI